MVKKGALATIDLGGQRIEYRLVRSKAARKLRVRVGIDGIEVTQPVKKCGEDLEAFLKHNQKWIISQIGRLEYIRSVRKPPSIENGKILFRGEEMSVSLKESASGNGSNKVVFENGAITIFLSPRSRTSPPRSLENWLRKQARMEIENQLRDLSQRLGKHPNRIYVRGQKTKWGNCSASNNLSFNWRLIMAPDFVMRYLITHELVHLEVMGHSQQFWLIVQSFCPGMSRAKQWLRTNEHILMKDLRQTCSKR